MNTTIKNTSTNLIASVHENAYETLMSSLNELDTICEIENKFFKFIKNNKMRHNLAAAFLGARYIFLLGKELKVRDELSRVMLRIQLLEYASICEAILNAIHWDWEKHNAQIGSNTQSKKKSFYCLIEWAAQNNVITEKTKRKLHDLRSERNQVHINTKNRVISPKKTYKAYMTLINDVIKEVRRYSNKMQPKKPSHGR